MVEIPLRDRAGAVVAVALIDDEDRALAELRWHLSAKGYARRNVWDRSGDKPICRTEFLHRRVLGLTREDPRRADHVNRDKLDCRRSNLRAVTEAQNRHNMPPRRRGLPRGVYARPGGRWAASACGVHLGTFGTQAAAARAVRRWRALNLTHATD